MIKKLIFLIIIILYTLFEVSCQTIKSTNNMQSIQYIPKEFHDVKLDYYESSENECTPEYKSKPIEFLWNKILINIPQKITYNIKDYDFKPVIPICGVYTITSRRGLKYAHLSARKFYIRKVGNENWYSGEIVNPASLSEDPIIYPPNYYKQIEEGKRKVEEAQKYSDEELNEGQASGSGINVDLMEYVNIPLESGTYEIYLAFSGLESNHAFVEIVFEGKQKSFDPHQEKMNCLEQAPEIEAELPEI